ncbi:putative quinol monooxygenase [Amycolatopsis jejuensis]|uniref:putative quinol monooxygenase n=1 Tax=Amycolatopsis jejuensis TaxID=330084 RepID=UPI00052783FD|nr:antibiotic biosynthesis monooxygenase [Amycolatopsis jejuensis]
MILITKFHPNSEESAAELRQRLLKAATAVPAEQGNLGYEVCELDGTPGTLYVVESWQTAADADRHVRLMTESGAIAGLTPLLAEPLHTTTLNELRKQP